MSTTVRATIPMRSQAPCPRSASTCRRCRCRAISARKPALMAGLQHARHGALLFMDGDGQHPPTLIERLVGHWLDDGYDVVYTAKAHRDQELMLRRAGVKTFYTLINFRARHKIPEDAGDFRLLSPRAADALRQLPERNRFFKGLASWIGFRQLRVDYEPTDRAHGRTSWNFGSLIGLSIEGLTSFSVAPLRIASLLGRAAGDRCADLRHGDPVRDADVREIGAGLSVGRGRPDGARRRATHHDRRARRIYRQDPVRAEGAAGLFRCRASDPQRNPTQIEKPAKTDAPGAAAWSDDRRRARGASVLCADDYGISPGVNAAIRDLIAARPHQCHLGDGGGAVSHPTGGRRAHGAQGATRRIADRPAFHADRTVPPGQRYLCRAGTTPFCHCRRRSAGALMRAPRPRHASRTSCAHRSRRSRTCSDTSPDFVDGHQHVQIFPQVRDAVVSAMREMLPRAHGCGNAAASRRSPRASPTARACCST